MTEEDPPSPSVPDPAPPPDAAPSAPAPEAAPSPPEEPIDWETRFKYLLADFENYRKRTERDRGASRLRAEADLLRGLLPIHEAFERAEKAVGGTPASDPVRRGMELLARAWDDFLSREGVAPTARTGERFDAETHEAVAETPAGHGGTDGTIAEVVQQGYRFKGGLLRPAKVVVTRAPSKGAGTPGAAAQPKDGAVPEGSG